jgi:hypothetical protein
MSAGDNANIKLSEDPAKILAVIMKDGKIFRENAVEVARRSD